MHSRLLPRKEVKAEATFTKNRWTHRQNDTRKGVGAQRGAKRPARLFTQVRLSAGLGLRHKLGMAVLANTRIFADKLLAVRAADMRIWTNNELTCLGLWQPATLLETATVNTICEEPEKSKRPRLGFFCISDLPESRPNPSNFWTVDPSSAPHRGGWPTSMRSHLPPGMRAPRPLSLRHRCSWA